MSVMGMTLNALHRTPTERARADHMNATGVHLHCGRPAVRASSPWGLWDVICHCGTIVYWADTLPAAMDYARLLTRRPHLGGMP